MQSDLCSAATEQQSHRRVSRNENSITALSANIGEPACASAAVVSESVRELWHDAVELDRDRQRATARLARLFIAGRRFGRVVHQMGVTPSQCRLLRLTNPSMRFQG